MEDVLEKPTLSHDSPEALLQNRNEMMKQYQGGVKDKSAMMETLNQKLVDMERRHEHGEEENVKEVPDISLSKEKNWEQFGWSERQKSEAAEKLSDILDLRVEQFDSKDTRLKKRHTVERILQMLVASGVKPEDIEEKLTEEFYQNLRKEFVQQQKRSVGENASDELIEEVYKDRIDTSAKTEFLHRLGIERDDYIQRFILQDEYKDKLNEEYRGGYANNLYDLAWNIGFSMKEEYGIDGRFPILELKVNKKKVLNKAGHEEEITEGRYVINQANYMRWMRSQLLRWYDFETDEQVNYFERIKVDKGNFTSVTLYQMLFEEDTYFRDETGHKWSKLWDQSLLEPFIMIYLRQYHLEYEQNQGSEEKLAETYHKIFHLSKLTRKLYNKSMIYYLATLPVDFEGERNDDTREGQAWTKMFLAYYNLADFDGLQDALGKESEFFTFEGWKEAIGEIHEEAFEHTGMLQNVTFLGDKSELFIKAFAKKDGEGKPQKNSNGDIVWAERVQDKKAFCDFINIFTTLSPPSNVVEILNIALQNAVKEGVVSKEGNTDKEVFKDKELRPDLGNDYVTDKTSLRYAWLIANSWTFFSGAASKNNFPAVSGHNAETKWRHTRWYRMKYMNKYGGAGKYQTIHMFPQLGTSFMEGVTVENAYKSYKSVDKETGELKPNQRKMVLLEVMNNAHAESERYVKLREDLRKKYDALEEQNLSESDFKRESEKIQKKLEALSEEETIRYKQLAQDLEFDENAMQDYALNVIGRAKVLYDQIMGAQEIDFDKFTKYDGIFRGVSFDRAEFQKAIQGSLITPLRYLFEANGMTHMNMDVRVPIYIGGKDEYRWQTVKLGEAMFGYEILNIPQFRMEAKHVDSGNWEQMKKDGYKKRGKWVITPDGRYMIDYDKVEDNKRLAWQQWMLMKIGADLWSHIDRHSTDPAYGMEHYMNVLDAIKSIPGELQGDDEDITKNKNVKTFFDKDQMRWLKEMSKTTALSLFTRQFFGDIFIGDKKKKESLLGQSFGIIINKIFQGY